MKSSTGPLSSQTTELGKLFYGQYLEIVLWTHSIWRNSHSRKYTKCWQEHWVNGIWFLPCSLTSPTQFLYHRSFTLSALLWAGEAPGQALPFPADCSRGLTDLPWEGEPASTAHLPQTPVAEALFGAVMTERAVGHSPTQPHPLMVEAPHQKEHNEKSRGHYPFLLTPSIHQRENISPSNPQEKTPVPTPVYRRRSCSPG